MTMVIEIVIEMQIGPISVISRPRTTHDLYPHGLMYGPEKWPGGLRQVDCRTNSEERLILQTGGRIYRP